jgi:hypothetical protein
MQADGTVPSQGSREIIVSIASLKSRCCRRRVDTWYSKGNCSRTVLCLNPTSSPVPDKDTRGQGAHHARPTLGEIPTSPSSAQMPLLSEQQVSSSLVFSHLSPFSFLPSLPVPSSPFLPPVPPSMGFTCLTSCRLN